MACSAGRAHALAPVDVGPADRRPITVSRRQGAGFAEPGWGQAGLKPELPCAAGDSGGNITGLTAAGRIKVFRRPPSSASCRRTPDPELLGAMPGSSNGSRRRRFAAAGRARRRRRVSLLLDGFGSRRSRVRHRRAGHLQNLARIAVGRSNAAHRGGRCVLPARGRAARRSATRRRRGTIPRASVRRHWARKRSANGGIGHRSPAGRADPPRCAPRRRGRRTATSTASRRVEQLRTQFALFRDSSLPTRTNRASWECRNAVAVDVHPAPSRRRVEQVVGAKVVGQQSPPRRRRAEAAVRSLSQRRPGKHGVLAVAQRLLQNPVSPPPGPRWRSIGRLDPNEHPGRCPGEGRLPVPARRWTWRCPSPRG